MTMPTARQMLIILLLTAGLGLSVAYAPPGSWSMVHLVPVAIELLLLAIPPVRVLTMRVAAAVSNPSPSARRWISLGLALLSFAYLILAAKVQERELWPRSHDEQAYLIQMQMLARGRLWMPPHPLGEFFDTYFVQM